MNATSISSKTNHRYIQCHIENEIFGLDTDRIDRIGRTEGFRAELGESGQVGFLDEEIPVVDLAIRLGLRSKFDSSDLDRRIIVFKDNDRRWGLMVDRVSQVILLSSRQLFPVTIPVLLTDPAINLFEQVAEFEERIMLILSPDRLSPFRVWEPNLTPELTSVSTGDQTRSQDSSVSAAGPNQIAVFADPSIRTEMLFALSITQIAEILEPQELVQIPLAPEYIEGFVKWRNRPVIVVNLCDRLGYQRSEHHTQSSRLIITRVKNEQGELDFVGVIADPSIQIMKLPIAYSEQDEELPFDSLFAKAVVKINSSAVMVPDLRNMLTIPSKN